LSISSALQQIVEHHAALPNQILCAARLMGSKAFDLQFRLPGATVEAYQQVL